MCVSHSFACIGGPLQVRDSALRPLDGGCWWKEAESPWQCLAVCTDLVAAVDSPDPTKYLSCLPVHQDGEGYIVEVLKWGRNGVVRLASSTTAVCCWEMAQLT